MSDSLQPHGLQHIRLPCLSPIPRACSNSYPSGQWCHPTISSSVIPFSFCLLSSNAPIFLVMLYPFSPCYLLSSPQKSLCNQVLVSGFDFKENKTKIEWTSARFRYCESLIDQTTLGIPKPKKRCPGNIRQAQSSLSIPALLRTLLTDNALHGKCFWICMVCLPSFLSSNAFTWF